MPNYKTLKYETKGPVGLVELNRPEKINAVNMEMMTELEGLLEERRNDNEVRVLILSGAGEKGFCSGLDIKDTLPEVANSNTDVFYRFQSRCSRLLLTMRQIPQPIIVAVHGAAAGLGFSLAMASDIRIADENARFTAAYINIGYGGADMASSYFLPRLIGSGRAYEFLLTGDFMDAQTAFDLGMLSRVVARDDLLPTAVELAEKLAAKNPLGLRLTKEAININLDAAGLEAALRVEDRNQALCFGTIRYEGYGSNMRV